MQFFIHLMLSTICSQCTAFDRLWELTVSKLSKSHPTIKCHKLVQPIDVIALTLLVFPTLSLSLFYFFSLVPFSIWCLWVEDKAPILSSPKPQTGLDKIVSRIDGSQGFLFLELALSPSLNHTLCHSMSLLSLPICVYLRSYRSLCFYLSIIFLKIS